MRKFYVILVNVLSVLFIAAHIFCASEYFALVFQDTTQNRIIASASLFVVLLLLYFILWFIGEEITTMLILEFLINIAFTAVVIILQFTVPEFVLYIIYVVTVFACIWVESDGTFIDGR